MAEALFDEAAARLIAGEVAAARELFRRAGGAGHRRSGEIFVNLVAQGVGGPRDWSLALHLLRGLARAGGRSAAELALIEKMALTRSGDPVSVPRGEPVCSSPHILRFERLFTAEECRFLIDAAEPLLEPAVIVDQRTGRQRPDPLRVSEGAGFNWPLENPAVHALNRRLAAASGTAVEQGEPLQVLRYAPGGEYRTHFDAIAGFSNQRVFTMLIWLNEGYEGGETWFETPRLALKGGVGDAILFRNTLDDEARDPAAAHAGLPVKAGEKLIASRWIRARPYAQVSGDTAA